MATQSMDLAAMLANVMAIRKARKEKGGGGSDEAIPESVEEAAAPVADESATRAMGESRVPGRDRTMAQKFTRTGENMSDALQSLFGGGAPQPQPQAEPFTRGQDPARFNASMQSAETNRHLQNQIPITGQSKPGMPMQQPPQDNEFRREFGEAFDRGLAKKAKIDELMAQGMSRMDAMRAVYRGGGTGVA